MENKQTICVRTDDAIALCHIIDEFETFNENLINFLNTTSNDVTLMLSKLYKISKGDNVIGSKRIKQFYNDNKIVIDKIKKYTSLIEFIFANYNFGLKSEFSSNYLYQYILENKDKLDKILAVLTKLKELGFTAFNFNTNLDFTKEIYSTYSHIYTCNNIIYLENLEAIPSYDNSIINYKTNDSCYKMILTTPVTKISPYVDKIILNDLTFDPSRLPKELTTEETVNKILALPKEKGQEYHIIRNSVDLSVGIDDLYSMYSEINRQFNSLEGVDSKEELLEELRKVKEAIDKMTVLSQQYDKKMISSNEEITETLLTEEKEAYVRRREWIRMDIHH